MARMTSPVRGRRYRCGQERGRGRGRANGRHVEKGDRLGCMEVGVALIVDLDNSTSPFEWEIANVSSPTSGLLPRQLPAFGQPVGPVPRTTQENTLLKIFCLFVSFTLFDPIIEQTRLLAVRQKKKKKYFNITKDEFCLHLLASMSPWAFLSCS